SHFVTGTFELGAFMRDAATSFDDRDLRRLQRDRSSNGKAAASDDASQAIGCGGRVASIVSTRSAALRRTPNTRRGRVGALRSMRRFVNPKHEFLQLLEHSASTSAARGNS